MYLEYHFHIQSYVLLTFFSVWFVSSLHKYIPTQRKNPEKGQINDRDTHSRLPWWNLEPFLITFSNFPFSMRRNKPLSSILFTICVPSVILHVATKIPYQRTAQTVTPLGSLIIYILCSHKFYLSFIGPCNIVGYLIIFNYNGSLFLSNIYTIAFGVK